MKLFVTVYDEPELLPHFLKWYSRRGISHFHVGVWNFETRKDREKIVDLVRFSKIKNVFLEQHATGFLDTAKDVSWIDAKINSVTNVGDWYIIPKLEEFHEPPASFRSFADWAEEASRNREIEYCYSYLQDRLTKDGSIPQLDQSDIFEQFPVVGFVTLAMTRVETTRPCLSRARSVELGLNPENTFTEVGICHYFGWCGEVLDKLESRKLTLAYGGVLNHLSSNDYRFSKEFLDS